jgi:hypothetical protein
MNEYETWKADFLKTVLSLPHNADLKHLEELSLSDCIDAACRAATGLNCANEKMTYSDVPNSVIKRKNQRILRTLSKYFPPNTQFNFTGEPLGAPVEITVGDAMYVLPYEG